jgi:hypothetical protein
MTAMKRPRFTLRTLFVIVTLLAIACAWIGHQLSVVRERAYTALDAHRSFNGRRWEVRFGEVAEPAKAPWYRRILGDKDYGLIFLSDDCSDELTHRVMRVFPGDVYKVRFGTGAAALVEATTEQEARSVAATLRKTLGTAPHIGVYQLFCSLDRADLDL